MTMRSLQRRIRRTPSSQSIQVGGACEDSAPQRQLRLSRTSAVLSKAIESTDEAPEESTRSRKRDRLRNFLTRRRGNLTRAFLWPDKDESRSSDGTEECDDVYMVDYHSDSDSDDDSLCGDNYVTPPVAIPELY
ncbi:hypothetical protein PF005_g12580 [Phytophthora fragariae]|uniref:Uncharacterized protein n=2 Tax=Phytophthora fragariae TaxID=53985 RepID=A0A6A3XUM3_9STRA|nr:hypothetical protein PF005_g12580 [Phytophthora fragariae]KAE9306811.1 hypothetical protein PF001_g11931 [Phytophthora fragariae]